MAQLHWKKIPILPLILTWAVQWLLWLLFAANCGLREALIGIIGAGIGTLAGMVFAKQARKNFRFRFRWVAEGLRMPWYALQGSGEVLLALCHQLFTRKGAESFVGAVAFDMGGDDPLSAGRRALAVTYTTTTPNFVIFDLLPERGWMLYHQVVPGEILTMTKNLGARP